MTVRRRLWRLASIGAAVTVLLGSLGVHVATSAPAQAATSQFRGVNWADARDNFLYDENVPIGLSKSDSYATNYTTVSDISVDPPLRMIQVDCVWRFMGGRLFTNTVITYRAPDQ